MTEQILVRMDRVTQPDEPGPHTVLIGEGTTKDGQHVTFAGDRRVMLLLAEGIAEAAQAGEQVFATIEPWQIIPEPSDPLQRCSCGHSLLAHAEPVAEGVPWGGCDLCQCREAWPVERTVLQ